jgi:hypothetical protein
MMNNLNKWVLYIFLFVGVVFPTITNADFQQGINGRTGTTFDGVIYCPNNEKITHFELAFDTSSAARAGVPYDLKINGTTIYSNKTPGVNTSGLHMFATTTPVSHDPVDCFGQANWVASSTSAASMRIYYGQLNGGTYAFTPSYTTANDRYVSYNLPGATSFPNYVGGIFRFQNSVFYLATSTSGGGGGGGDMYVTTPNDDLITFVLLFALWVGVIVAIFKFINLFYARK